VTLIAASLSVRLPGGVVAHITTAPILGAVFDPQMANPFAVCWVALLGTIEIRDVRREIPWYGTLYNKFSYVLAAFAAWIATSSARLAPCHRQSTRRMDSLVVMLIASRALPELSRGRCSFRKNRLKRLNSRECFTTSARSE